MSNREFAGEKISGNITLCPDGKYRWRYDVPLFKNLTFYFLVWKILFFIILGIFVFTMLADIINYGFEAEMLLNNLKFIGYFVIGMTVVSALGDLI